MTSGLFCTVQALQLWGFRLRGIVVAVPYAMLAIGLALIVIGFLVVRMRGWAHIVAIGVAAVLLLGSVVWLFFGLVSGFVSLLAFGMPPLALITIVVLAITVPASLRADEARQRLAQAGIQTGT